MNKREFLHRLNDSLYKLPDYERVDAVNFYDEIISDKIEAGLSEDEAVASLGDVNRLRAYITAESVENSMRRKSSAVIDQAAIVVPPQKDGDSDRAGRRDGHLDDYGYFENRDQSRRDRDSRDSRDNRDNRDNRDREYDKRESKREDKRNDKCDCGRRDHDGCADDVYQSATADKKQWKGSNEISRKPKNPIKSFFTVFALCTSPVLVVLGIALFVVLLSVLVSFAATAIGLFAGAVGALVYGAATAYLTAQTYGIAAAAMTGCAYLFASALLSLFGAVTLKIAAIITKSVVALFARLVKKNNSNVQPAKEGAK